MGDLMALNHLCETKIMLCKIIQRQQEDTKQTPCTIHHKFLKWKTLKEVKTTRPSPEIIHYQCKTDTPKLYSKQVRVLIESEEYSVSSKAKLNKKDTKTTPKTHNPWLMTEAAMSGCLSVLV